MDTLVPVIPPVSSGRVALAAGPALGPAAFADVRRRTALDHCKWDPQVGDSAALARFPLIVSAGEWARLSALARALYDETVRAEAYLLARPDLHRRLGVPRGLRGVLRAVAAGAATPAAARVMRFDFHPTADGWRVSEVNADVPGGYAEAGPFTRLMAGHYLGCAPAGDPAAVLVDAIADGLGTAANRAPLVALLWAPGFLEDYQVVAHLAGRLRGGGMDAVLTTPAALRWVDGRARVATPAGPRPVAAVVRFYQAEWLARVPWRDRRCWPPLLAGGRTPVCNPAGAVLTESKRFPLVWAGLPFDLPAWRALLPETRDPRDAPWRADDGWLLKSAYCNTGDAVAIRSLLPSSQWDRFARAARFFPGRWLAQRRFAVAPVDSPAGPVYACVGVYVIDGRVAGAYARTSASPVIAYSAADTALLVARDGG